MRRAACAPADAAQVLEIPQLGCWPPAGCTLDEQRRGAQRGVLAACVQRSACHCVDPPEERAFSAEGGLLRGGVEYHGGGARWERLPRRWQR